MQLSATDHSLLLTPLASGAIVLKLFEAELGLLENSNTDAQKINELRNQIESAKKRLQQQHEEISSIGNKIKQLRGGSSEKAPSSKTVAATATTANEDNHCVKSPRDDKNEYVRLTSQALTNMKKMCATKEQTINKLTTDLASWVSTSATLETKVQNAQLTDDSLYKKLDNARAYVSKLSAEQGKLKDQMMKASKIAVALEELLNLEQGTSPASASETSSKPALTAETSSASTTTAPPPPSRKHTRQTSRNNNTHQRQSSVNQKTSVELQKIAQKPTKEPEEQNTYAAVAARSTENLKKEVQIEVPPSVAAKAPVAPPASAKPALLGGKSTKPASTPSNPNPTPVQLPTPVPSTLAAPVLTVPAPVSTSNTAPQAARLAALLQQPVSARKLAPPPTSVRMPVFPAVQKN